MFAAIVSLGEQDGRYCCTIDARIKIAMTEPKEYPFINVDEIPCQEISDSNVLVKEPVVSVKMITYNHAPYIAQAIEGVIQQETDFPFELVIGEDCSTDGTREIVLEYQKKYPDIIRVIASEHNVGASKKGMRTEKACRGKYIAYCEGDDYWHHLQKLQKQVDFLETHSEVGLVHSECNFHYEESNRIVVNYYEKSGKSCAAQNVAEKLIDLRYSIITCTVCLRKNILEKFILDYPELFSEEWPFGDLQRWFGVALNSSVFFFQDSLATRRVLPESASYSKNTEKRMHFCRKEYDFRILCIETFHLSVHARNRMLISQSRALLWFSFLLFRPEIACDSRLMLSRMAKKVTFKQNLIYIGAQYKWANVVLKLLWVLLRTLFPKQHLGH